ncbi:flagellar assembly protein T N-terminal domain-containing protein [Hyalangium versicolor]|uniref:flagellar assembly protein T N-terminal domain-containing protein n=1 Tax=Hyalangium versicolor TaxID=2861190 RepID=UPI001CCEB81E|nr:flagellar assembly protein T N-terminal domain-containing protein [Hyalangium versicolor]
MNALKLTVLSWLVAAVALAADKTPEFVTQEATGEAAIVDNNRDKALQDAKSAALREAVEQVAGVLLSSSTLTANNQLVSDRVFSRSDGYVRKYEVLEKKEEKGVMKVAVRAEVGTAQLDRDLQAVKALVERLAGSRLLIVVQEQSVSPDKVITETNVLSQILAETFQKDGWRIIDPAFAAGKLEVSSGVSLLTPEKKVIQELRSADYIVTGKVTLRYEPPKAAFELKGYYPVTGEFELAVFATDSGTQIAHVSDKLTSQGVPVLVSYESTAHGIAKLRGQKIVDEVRRAVVEYLSKSEQNGSAVVVTVLGLTDYASVSEFKKLLGQTVTGLRDVKQGDFIKGKATFDALLVGSTDDFADALSQKTYQGKKVSVTGVTANTVEITLAK